MVNLAVLGATGVVGETMLDILATRKFPCDKVYALASERSLGSTVLYGKKNLDVLDVATFDFSKVQIALFSAGSSVSAIYAPIAAKAGCVVIDNTSCFRYENDIPLIVPEVNAAQISDYKKPRYIAKKVENRIKPIIIASVRLKSIYKNYLIKIKLA